MQYIMSYHCLNEKWTETHPTGQPIRHRTHATNRYPIGLLACWVPAVGSLLLSPIVLLGPEWVLLGKKKKRDWVAFLSTEVVEVLRWREAGIYFREWGGVVFVLIDSCIMSFSGGVQTKLYIERCER